MGSEKTNNAIQTIILGDNIEDGRPEGGLPKVMDKQIRTIT